MVDVFISYSRADEEKVGKLADAIAAEGYDVWWDADLPPHMSYGDVITAKIGAAKAAVVVWSETAAASEWVRAEADVARGQKKLIQTSLDNVMPPLPFNQIQCAEIGDWNGESDHRGWRKVKESLTALCGPRSASDEGGVRSTMFPDSEPAPAPAPPPPPPPSPSLTKPTPTPARARRRARQSSGAGAPTPTPAPTPAPSGGTHEWTEAQRKSAAMANPDAGKTGTGSSTSSGNLKFIGIGCGILAVLFVLLLVVAALIPTEEEPAFPDDFSTDYVDPTYEDYSEPTYDPYAPPPEEPAPSMPEF